MECFDLKNDCTARREPSKQKSCSKLGKKQDQLISSKLTIKAQNEKKFEVGLVLLELTLK